MNLIKAVMCFAFMLNFLSNSISADVFYPDFVVSMMREGGDLIKYEDIFIKEQNLNNFTYTKSLEIFRNAYARNILASRNSNEIGYRIPRIVHQIWLGSPVPVKYYAWMSSWMNWLGWEYKLWTDADVKNVFLYNQELYDQATNYGEKSDILRLELLLHYGGIYADVDFECVNFLVMDELNRSFDFYIGFEPLEHGTINGIYKVCNAIIGSIPYHPLIKDLVVNMGANWKLHEHETAVEKSGPDYYSRSIMSYELNELSPEKKVDHSHYRTIYLPCTFFYPFSEPEIRGARSRSDLLSRVSPETGAIHYWSGSWIPGGR